MKKIIWIILLLAVIQTGKSQQATRHELSFWGGGGLSSIQYSLSIGEHKPGYGGLAGMGYTFFFHPNWGVMTGAEFAVYNGKARIDNASDAYAAIDDENDTFTKLVDVYNFEENQRAYYLNIPLMFQYQGNGTNKFYAALGAKIGIPVGGKYKSAGDYVTRGKYPFTKDIFENMPEHGFGTYDDLKADESIKWNTNFQLSVEAGYKWQLRENLQLYTGMYFDYGLSDIRKIKNSPQTLLGDNASNPAEFTVNSIIQSHYTVENGTEGYVGRMNTISFGVKARIAFSLF
ncbi:MAG: PorT family protein [Tannerella sp.]|jgi:hypothetical protein|nr:PorT family protein [Tannerella sp.]